MNHRRALRASTDTGLTIFLMMIVGVILWTTDEVLDWNLLPDWIDKYAQLLVIVLSILAAFAVVISVMCSFAVIAESAAGNAGIKAPTRSWIARILIVFGILLAFGIMFGLHKLDQYRENLRTEEVQQRLRAKYDEIQTDLHNRIPAVLALFSSDMMQSLTHNPSQAGDEAIARLLDAIQVSTPFDPSVSILVTASPPYTHSVITVLPESQRQTQADDWNYLRRRYLTSFPSDWEKVAVRDGFEGKLLQAPLQQAGVFINTHQPSSWGTLTNEGRAIGILMLQGTM